MHIMIEISKEFEKDYDENKFEDCFQRLLSDTRDRIDNHDTLMAGNYEIETLEMLIKSFKKADLIDEEMVSFVKRGIFDMKVLL